MQHLGNEVNKKYMTILQKLSKDGVLFGYLNLPLCVKNSGCNYFALESIFQSLSSVLQGTFQIFNFCICTSYLK